MQAVARWLLKPIVLLGILTLPGTGCTQQNNNSATDATPTTSSAPAAGATSFVTEARTMPFGTKDLAAASERDLLRLGNVVCDGLGIQRLGYRRVVQRLVQSEACPTPAPERSSGARWAISALSMPAPSTDLPATVHIGYTRSRQAAECGGHERTPPVRNLRSPCAPSHDQRALWAADRSASLPPDAHEFAHGTR